MPLPLTERAGAALSRAARLAEERNNPETTPEHLLAALLDDAPDGLALRLLRRLDVEPAVLGRKLDAALGALPVQRYSEAEAPPASRDLAKVIHAASGEAKKLGDEFLSLEHLLLALVSQKSAAGAVLGAAGVDRRGWKPRSGRYVVPRAPRVPTPRAPTSRSRSTGATLPRSPAPTSSTR